MFEKLGLFPRSASTVSDSVDLLYFFLIGVSAFFVALIVFALIGFSIRYRRRPGHTATQIEGSLALEALWTVIPLGVVLVMFTWGTQLFVRIKTPPKDGMEYYVTGKQWMWKIQHPTGQREINTLHVPVGEPVSLTMISEDVIHDFFIPAFRVKADVVPGSYSRLWFEATEVGTYHLFCAEYCGTKHSEMIGRVVVMDPAEYQVWLSGQPAGVDPVEAGRILFENMRCVTCHAAGSGQRGPDLAGRFGTTVLNEDGSQVIFDEDHVRESILEPKRKVSLGYQPLMPTYDGQLGEDQILQIISYLKTLESPEGTDPGDGQNNGGGSDE